jgi:translation initiation factor eIF-2B subunit delta
LVEICGSSFDLPDTPAVVSFDDEVQRIAGDRSSGASSLLEAALDVLEAALRSGTDVLPLARDLIRAQPTMAPVWTAAIAAVTDTDEPGRFARFATRARRAPAALTRVAVDVLRREERSPLHVVTLSYSGAVRRALTAAAAIHPVRVSCAEGRPALEGRRLASDLVAAGIPVTCYGDAAIAAALDPGAIVVLGADAFGPDRFVNKTGTRMLAAAATLSGVPLYVLATRDKFVTGAIADRLQIRDERPDEIWPQPPPGVEVHNRYFEATPVDLVSGIVTDAGVIGPGDVAAVCHATLDELAQRALLRLL